MKNLLKEIYQDVSPMQHAVFGMIFFGLGWYIALSGQGNKDIVIGGVLAFLGQIRIYLAISGKK